MTLDEVKALVDKRIEWLVLPGLTKEQRDTILDAQFCVQDAFHILAAKDAPFTPAESAQYYELHQLAKHLNGIKERHDMPTFVLDHTHGFIGR